MPKSKVRSRQRSGSCPEADTAAQAGSSSGGLRSGQSLDNEYFFKSQESLATVIDNDEENTDEGSSTTVPALTDPDSKMSHSSSL